jgi:tRNA 2-thiouridine synthesizing protein A
MLALTLINCDLNTMNFDQELDTRGLKCPLPILRCKKALSELAAGQVLKAYATDPGAVKDFQAFCKQTGHGMLALEETKEGDTAVFVFHIQKKAA